jgi:uncharacterized SAM-binding protein YcdF (DUF218 family)
MLFWLKKTIGFWLMPVPVCLFLLVVGASLSCVANKRRARIGRRLLVTGVVLLLLFSNKLVSRWLAHPIEAKYAAIPELAAGAPLPPQLAACRYVMVLGGGNGNSPGVCALGELSSSALGRITEAVRLLRVLPEAKLVVSGPHDDQGHVETHAVMLARAAMSLGIDEHRIVLVEQAHDTEDESHAAAAVIGDKPFVLVTSAWHMPRSVALFRSAGLNPLPAPADFVAHDDGQWHWRDLLCDVESLVRSTCAVRERVGYAWIWLRGKAQ